MSRKTVLYIILFFLYMGFNPFRIIGMNELKAEIVQIQPFPQSELISTSNGFNNNALAQRTFRNPPKVSYDEILKFYQNQLVSEGWEMDRLIIKTTRGMPKRVFYKNKTILYVEMSEVGQAHSVGLVRDINLFGFVKDPRR